jgi:hypothetical protein
VGDAGEVVDRRVAVGEVARLEHGLGEGHVASDAFGVALRRGRAAMRSSMSMPSRAGWPVRCIVHQARRSATVSAEGPRMLGVPSSATSTGRRTGVVIAAAAMARIGTAR